MKKTNKFMLLILLLVTSMVFLIACNDDTETSTPDGDTTPNGEVNKDEEPEEPEQDPEEALEDVTLIYAYPWGEDGFQSTKELVEDKFPHVTLEYVDGQTDHPQTFEDLIASGVIPDIVQMGQVNQISVLDELGLAVNHDEIIEQIGFDLDRFEDFIIEYARNRDPNQEGGLYAIPNGRAVYSLHYNKDIFDTLGVEYPTDGMTWAEVIELAEEVTREYSGVQYRGLDLDVPSDSFTQFNVNTVDPITNEVLIAESDAFRRYLEMVEAAVTIPGNYPEDNPGDLLHNWGGAWGEGNVAMTPQRTHFGWLSTENVDIVTYPVWEGYENLMPVANGGAYAVTEPSENKEIALEIIEFLMSDELQIEESRAGGHPSVLSSQEIKDAYAQDNPDIINKNIDSLFLHENAVGPELLQAYDDGVLWTAAINYVNSGDDINEFLRLLQEQAEENVRQALETE